jgi:hypothetical protein
MIDPVGWLRDRFGDDEPPAPDPAAERAVKLPQEAFEGPDDGDRDG